MPYMPPELLAHSQLTPQADVYSFGMVMWEIYTGQVLVYSFTPNYITLLTYSEVRVRVRDVQVVERHTTEVCCGLPPSLMRCSD